MQQQKEKVRMFALARELNMESKDLLALCQEHGLEIKNQLSTVEPDVQDQIRRLVEKQRAPVKSAPPPAPAAPPKPLAPTRPIKNLDTAARPVPRPAEPPAPAAQAPSAPAEVPAPVAPAPVTPPPAPAAEAPSPTVQAPTAEPVAPAPVVPPTPAAAHVPEQEKPAPAAAAAPPAAPPAPSTPAAPPRPLSNMNIRPTMRNLNAPRASTPPQAPPPRAEQPPAPPRPPASTPPPAQRPPAAQAPSRPAGGTPQARPPAGHGHHPTRPVQVGAPRPGVGGLHRGGQGGPGGQRPGTPTPPAGPQQRGGPPGAKPTPPGSNQPRKISEIPPELMAQLQGRDASSISVKEIEERIRNQARGVTPGAPGTVPETEGEVPDDEEGRDKKKGGPAGTGGPGGVAGRADRHKERAERQAKRKEAGSDGRRISLTGEDDEGRHRSRRPKMARPKPQGTIARKGKIPVTLPISIRSLSEAMGRKANELIAKSMTSGYGMFTINSIIEPETAELLAIDFGCELEIKRTADVEQELLDVTEQEDRPEDLEPRAPIVVIMGHVDHGKTSILDKIKEDNIVDTEAGGITQVLRAWRVMHGEKPITFLDTPGHQAFTKMRARGANVTDIAVIVVAANDGVMPQTEEAISHAKAAGVAIVVAINKVDLPDANLRKTEQQLYSLGLVPDDMGGDVPFVKTSAKTGMGIDELLEQIQVVAELLELKSNPSKPAAGTCLEAYLSEKEGVQATLLVQGGTLRTGDVVLCGHAYGTVRRLFDDRGRPIDEAGPSVPVRILGLDAVPNADDPFAVVQDIATAREIAEKRKERIQTQERAAGGRPAALPTLGAIKVTELKVILKAEARGSVEAIRAELEKLKHDEVRVRVLHTGIGAINASDVQLALTSPQDTLIVGFNVVADNEARSLAEERGIPIRDYQIIYELVDDIRSALEGKLKPREEVIHLGRAIVRETFKISKVGTIAGCFVTNGTIERSAKIRVIRGGVVVFPPAERSASLESLKRFKEDVREVRAGMECGVKLAGYDDIKVDDIIECYRIEQVQRSL